MESKANDQNEHLKALRHTTEHVMHQAVKELFPQIQLAMGPATDEGFYNDFDSSPEGTTPVVVSESDLTKIEKRMQEIIDLNLPLIRTEVTEPEARKLFTGNPYKTEWIDETAKKGEKFIIYWTGNPDEKNSMADFCRGPHVASTGDIKAFKLLSVAGAYWHGDEKNKMLTRIYGTAFDNKEQLEHFLWLQEEIKKRDHRKLGTQLGLWTFSELVGPGLPLFTQKGALIRRLINEFVEELQSKQNIAQVWTPQINKAELFKISGHYDKYKENIFRVISNYSDEEFFLKPMNCPQHTQIYASQMRSYRELPIRMSDFAMLYRDEKPGELMGLARVRAFSQDDCHVFCREDQVIDEMNLALDMTKEVMETYGFAYKYRLSVRDPKLPEKYIGDDKIWEKAEKLGEKILKDRGIEYFIGVGEAAFYGPKLDLIATDSLGREWQLSTLQIDYVMPERFNLSYIDEKGVLQRPVMLHRAISGSPERLMMVLVEHYAGAFPAWLSPVQAIIIPIAERHLQYAESVATAMKKENIRVTIDSRDEKMQAKIRDAQLQKIPYMLIVGDKESERQGVALRLRTGENLGLLEVSDCVQRIKRVVGEKKIEL